MREGEGRGEGRGVEGIWSNKYVYYNKEKSIDSRF